MKCIMIYILIIVLQSIKKLIEIYFCPLSIIRPFIYFETSISSLLHSLTINATSYDFANSQFSSILDIQSKSVLICHTLLPHNPLDQMNVKYVAS